MFDLQLLENNPNTPPFYLTLITVLTAFFLSSLVALTYQFTTKSIYRKPYFLQSLALISIVAATVMQAIGDSVATGLGMLGALSIIRFRSNLDDTRNITFMFASLAIGIACGVFGLSIALVGTLIFCICAIAFKYSPFHDPSEVIGNLKLQIPKHVDLQSQVEEYLIHNCIHFQLDELKYLNPKTEKVLAEEGEELVRKLSGDFQELTYSFRLNSKIPIGTLTDSLSSIEGLKGLKVIFKNQPAKL